MGYLFLHSKHNNKRLLRLLFIYAETQRDNSTYLEITVKIVPKFKLFPLFRKNTKFIYSSGIYFHYLGKMFIENIIGSKAKVKLLRVLAEVRTAYSLKSLVEETGLSLSITHKAAEELAQERVLTKIKGNKKERLYKFNSEGNFAAPIFELFKTEKTRQRGEIIFLKTWNVLENVLTKTKSKIDLMILFGSQVKGNATLRSDIDLLIIHRGKDSNLLELIKKVDKKLSPMFIDLKTFKSYMNNKTPLYMSLKKEGLILFIRKDIKNDLKEFLDERNEA